MSKFASSRVSVGGRKFFAKITEVEEQTKTFRNRDTGEDEDRTQLMLRYERPDGKYELDWYNIPQGDDPQISTRSDLGKLINYFAKMKIPDIGLNDYEPIKELYVECEVFPRKNRMTGEDTDKRFPIRLMTKDEIAQHFGGAAPVSVQQTDPTKLFESILPALKSNGALVGLPEQAVFTKLASIEEVANHPEANVIFEKAHDGSLLEWLKTDGGFKVDDDGNLQLAEADAEAS